MGSATIFIDKNWFDTNAKTFADDFDKVAKNEGDKGTQYMITVPEMYQSAIAIRNGQMDTVLALPASGIEDPHTQPQTEVVGQAGQVTESTKKGVKKDEKKTKPASLVYLSLTHDLNLESQQGIAMWLLRRMNRLAGLINIGLTTDDQTEE